MTITVEWWYWPVFWLAWAGLTFMRCVFALMFIDKTIANASERKITHDKASDGFVFWVLVYIAATLATLIMGLTCC